MCLDILYKENKIKEIIGNSKYLTCFKICVIEDDGKIMSLFYHKEFEIGKWYKATYMNNKEDSEQVNIKINNIEKYQYGFHVFLNLKEAKDILEYYNTNYVFIYKNKNIRIVKCSIKNITAVGKEMFFYNNSINYVTVVVGENIKIESIITTITP